MKLKKCRKCKQELPLDSYTSTQAHYCNNCRIIRKYEQDKARKERYIKRLETKKRKRKVVDSLPQLKKRAQAVFNKWIRNRDRGDGCISCINGKVEQAGHFWPQGSKGALRYHESNVHGQCTSCNKWKHGNLGEYRLSLEKKIGREKLEWLDKHRNDVKKWTREELKQIIKLYSQE